RMDRGISVMVFPEGTRGPGDVLLPFKKGGFVLALETGMPIVPIGVRGTRNVMPRQGWTIDAGDVVVRIGRPIETAGRSLDERNRLIEEVRGAIEALRAA
ncbi:MAG: lysophospholipid acyltransferase family protein, partial [Candidatus Binatia bacterium]